MFHPVFPFPPNRKRLFGIVKIGTHTRTTHMAWWGQRPRNARHQRHPPNSPCANAACIRQYSRNERLKSFISPAAMVGSLTFLPMLRVLILIATAVTVAHALPLHSHNEVAPLLSASSKSPMTCEVCEESLGMLVHEAVEAGWMGEAM